MRVYLPATMSRLRELERSGTVGAPPYAGCAVTPGLQEWYGEADPEELEWAASEEAALASLRLVAAEGAPPRRVVLPVEVADAAVTPDESASPAAVRVSARITGVDVASVHVDGRDAEPAVRAAVAALPAYDEGDPAAAAAIDALCDHALEWYAPQELADLLRT